MLKTKTVKKTQEKFSLDEKGSITAKKPIHMALDLSWNFGADVVVYDVRDKSPYVSYYIVASANNDRRLQSLLQAAKDTIYDNYIEIKHIEGKNGSK